MIWKALFAEPGLAFNRFGRIIVVLIVLASFLPAIWMGGHWLLDTTLGGGAWSWHELWPRLGSAINEWVRIVGTLAACLTLVGVAARAAGSITGERERQTLDALLTSPLESSTILYAKWLGSLFSLRWAWGWLCLVWGIGLVTGGLDIVTLPWLVLACFVYGGFVAVLGLWFSVRSRTTPRATMGTLATAAVLSFGHWLIWIMLWVPRSFSSSGGVDVGGWLERFQLYGLTPPAALAWLAFRTSDYRLPLISNSEDNPWFTLVALSAGLAVWSLAGIRIWFNARYRFQRLANRLPVEKTWYSLALARRGTLSTPMTEPLDRTVGKPT